jgi:hypothetical protein
MFGKQQRERERGKRETGRERGGETVIGKEERTRD